MGATIVPAVFPASRQDLERQLGELGSIAEAVQINVVDGRFATPPTWPYVLGANDLASMIAEHRMLPFWGRFRFEVELQAFNPEATLGQWIEVGANRLTIHAESATDLEALFRELEVRYGHDTDFSPDLLSVGLALGMDTDPALIEPFIDRLDYVQFMAVSRLGKHGEPFDTRVVERIRTFRKAHPSIPIQVDGGISRATAPALLDAGASRLIVGSDLWRAEDKAERYQELASLVERYGIYE